MSGTVQKYPCVVAPVGPNPHTASPAQSAFLSHPHGHVAKPSGQIAATPRNQQSLEGPEQVAARETVSQAARGSERSSVSARDSQPGSERTSEPGSVSNNERIQAV